jgi:hypothetical protein
MTLGIGCFLFGTLCVSEGAFRFYDTERVHYFWESFKYEQPLAPSRLRLWSIRAGAALEIVLGAALFWVGAVI